MRDVSDRARLAGIVGGIWKRVPSIYGAPGALEPLLADRYGWLDVAARMRPQVPALADLRRRLRAEGRSRAAVLGMGGSSLAAAVFRDVAGVRADGLGLAVLDSTHPDAVDAIRASHPAKSSAFIVASKSGTTTEPLCFQRHFWSHAVADTGTRAGDAFIAITDPGSSLAGIAARDGYRRTFANPPDIGGRYSALSFFGLVPAALAGLDVGAVLDAAEAAMARCRLTDDLDANPGARLGHFLARHAAAGRDKLTLHCPKPFAAFGTWVEQLVAESLGKGGRGILPIEGEPLADADSYGPDRVFVAIDIRHDRDPGVMDGAGGLDPRLDAIEDAGTPVLRLGASGANDLGWLFFIWEFATVVAAALLQVEPFDQPDVERAKVETRRALAAGSPSGQFGLSGDLDATGASPILAAAVATLAPRGYVALQAYLDPAGATVEALARLRDRMRARTDRPVTVGYGPRFLHSTGQLHKGGPPGLNVQLVDRTSSPERPIPGEWFGFGSLIAAQAVGDAMALGSLGRPVIRIDVGPEPSRAIDSILAGA